MAIDTPIADQFSTWDQIREFLEPLIGAVLSFALDGGRELAMTCDLLVASETARLGQPEICIGTMPGAGGTQRLTDEFISAREAHRMSLVSRVPTDQCLKETYRPAARIAAMSPVAARLAKESVNRAFETHLDEDLHFECKNFCPTFASQHHKKSTTAFTEKRKPVFEE